MESQGGAQNFGDFFRSKRISLGLTLRIFCERFGYDPGNISRLERNILPPTLDDEKLSGYAVALQIKRDSQEWVLFHDLAYTAKNSIPKDLRSDNQNFLPAFFRTVRNKKMDKQKLQELIKFLNNPPE
ncbi:MAG: Helix-turn-helix domain protein [Microgenomates group bacterium GW2011_GWC1_43_11]|nr:MAG: Helix-turn-helix domain protein [Microgenomates group bacterium GW2011_GWC1_43_11]